MTFLFELSKYIVIPILIEWLDGRSVLYLDAALSCVEIHRQVLTDWMIQYPALFEQCVMPWIGECCHSQYLVRWLARRGISMKDFTFTMDKNSLLYLKTEMGVNDDESVKDDFSCMKHIVSLNMIYAIDSAIPYINMLFHCCPNLLSVQVPTSHFISAIGVSCLLLRSLTVKCVTHPSVFHNVFVNCKQLSELIIGDIHHDAVFVYRLLNGIVVHCRSLTKIELPYLAFYQAHLLLCLMVSRKLVDVNINATYEGMRVFLWSRGSKLTKLSLVSTSYGSESVLQHLNACPELTDLTIYYLSDIFNVNAILQLAKLKTLSLDCYFTADLFSMVARKQSLQCIYLPYWSSNWSDEHPWIYITELHLRVYDYLPNHFNLSVQCPNLKSFFLKTSTLASVHTATTYLPQSLTLIVIQLLSQNQCILDDLVAQLFAMKSFHVLKHTIKSSSNDDTSITIHCKVDVTHNMSTQ